MTAIRSSTFSRRSPAKPTASTNASAVAESEPDYRAIYASTILAIAMLFFVGVGFPAAMAYGNATGWGLGAFCAFWGGPSFGVMAGFARVSAWQEAHDPH